MTIYPLVLPVLTGNPAFDASVLPFAILLAGIVVSAGYMPFQQTLLMAGHPALHTLLMALALATNAVGNALLVPRFTTSGSALATSMALVASCFFLTRLVRARVGLRI
jgi:O-antigen/teichoic acid export membrane protein